MVRVVYTGIGDGDHVLCLGVCGMKRGTMTFLGLFVCFVALSYITLPVFLVVFQTLIAGWVLLCLWFMLFHWWVVPLLSSSWAPSTELPDLRVTTPTKNSAIGCAKVLAGRELDHLSYALLDDDEYDEVQASLRARR